jgi:hypothetical protein
MIAPSFLKIKMTSRKIAFREESTAIVAAPGDGLIFP